MTHSHHDLLDDELIPHFVIIEIDSEGDYDVLEVYGYDENGDVDYRFKLVNETEHCHQGWAETIYEKHY